VIQKYIVLLFLLIWTSNSKAQSPSFFRIGTEEFSNIDVYSVFYEDETDVLYAATNRGLYAYKQNQFNRIEANKGQTVNSLFQLQSNHKGELFCCNLRGQVFTIKGGRLVLFYELSTTAKIHRFNYYFDTDDNLIVNSLSEVRKISTSGDETVLLNDSIFKQKNNAPLSIPMLFSNQLINGDLYFYFLDMSSYYKYKDGIFSLNDFPNTELNSGRNIFQLGGVTYYHSVGTFKRLDGKSFETKIKLSPRSFVTQLNTNMVAIRSPLNGDRIIELNDGIIKDSPLGIQNTFISAISLNKRGTVFLGSFKNGIYVIPNFEIYKYNVDYPFTGITSSPDNSVYLSNRKGQIFKHKDSLKLYGEYVFNISNLFHLNQSYYIGNEKIDGVIHNEIKSSFKTRSFDNLKDVVECENEYALFMSSKILMLIMKDSIKNEFDCFDRVMNDEVKGLVFDGRGKSVTYIPNKKVIYYSTSLGVFEMKQHTMTSPELLFNEQSILGNDLVHYKGQLIIGTEKSGLLVYTNGQFQNQVALSEDLKSNSIIKLEIHKDLLFVLSVKGLQVYDLINEKFISIGPNEGVFSSRVVNFALSKDKLWLIDKEGYYSYEINNIQVNDKVELGNVYLDSILINSHKINYSEKSIFSNEENKVEFYFDYRDIETKSGTLFKYQLLGISDKWISLESSINKIEFSSLSPGKYKFVLKASYRNDGTETIEYQFEILQPFWFQLWFVGLCVILIVLLVSFLFIFLIKRKEIKGKIESKIQNMKTAVFESKLEAIRSQMNPHFIFNSLNSIQALVLKKEVEKSYDYIEMFSDLVRKTLVFSEKNYVDINEETNFLNIYLKLESLRMKDEFSFLIENNSSKEILIPSLLIQPFLENAIHHGLLHKKGKKELLISFNCENEIGSCVIKDNGIGREKANEIKNRQQYRHESFSLNAMKKRLEILSEQNNKKFDYIIEDLYTNDGIASGTKVTVYFPFKYQY